MAQDKLQVALDFAVQGTPTEKLESEIKGATKAAEKLETAGSKAKGSFSKLGDTINDNKIAFGVLGAAGGIALAKLTDGIKDSMKEFASFQDIMLQVKSGTGSTDEEMKQLSDRARELGASTRFSATEMAQAQKYYGMAGYNAKQINEALKPTADLASASGEDLALVADIVSDTMTAFKLGADETERFADILSATSNASNTSVALMGETFKYVAPAAQALGVSIEESAKYIGILANNGIKGSQAGTTLRTALTKLNEVPTGMLKDLGLDAKTFNKLPIDDKINKLSGAFKNLSGQQQAAVAQEMFGQEAFTGMLTILNSNETETAALTKALSDYNGAAAKAADINNSGLSGSLDGLGGAFQELKITIGEQFTPVFQPMIDVITTATAWFAGFLAKTDMAIPILTTLGGVFMGLLIPALWLAATATWALIAPVLAAAAPFIAIGAAIGAVVGIITVLLKKFDAFNKVAGAIKGFFGSDTKVTTTQNINKSDTKSVTLPSHRTGESFVKNDGIAQLHYGERVLTRAENSQYSQGGVSQSPSINISINAVQELGNEIKRAIQPIVETTIKNYQTKQLMKMGIAGGQ